MVKWYLVRDIGPFQQASHCIYTILDVSLVADFELLATSPPSDCFPSEDKRGFTGLQGE